MIVVSVVLLCLGLPYIQGQANNAYQAFCFPSTTTAGDPGRIEATFSIENAQSTTVVRAKTVHASLTCKTAAGSTVVVNKGTVDANTQITKYTFTIDFAATPSQSDACGVVTTGTTAKTSTFVMEVRYIDNTLGVNDADVTVTCADWSQDPAAGEVSTPAAVAVTGTASPKTAVEVQDSVSNLVTEVWHAAAVAAGAAPGTLAKVVTGTTTVALGDDLSFRVVIADNTQLLNHLKGTKLIADHKPAFDSNEKQEMIDATGCGVPPFLLKTDFCEPDATYNAANPPKKMYECKRFKAFSFPKAATANEVYLQLSVQMCTTNACEVKTADCPARRRKRDAPKANSNETATLVARLTIYPYRDYVKHASSDQQIKNCMNNISFLAIIAVLAMLLIITVGFVVLFAVKATRSQAADRHSYPNPAFKS